LPDCSRVIAISRRANHREKALQRFYGTSLDEILGRQQPDALILSGINTHACIRTTAIDAYQRDWPVVLALDCIDSYDKQHHEISLKYMGEKLATVLTNAEIRAALAAAHHPSGNAR